MMNIYIELDPEKVEKSGESIESLQKYIDYVFQKADMVSYGEGWYYKGTFEKCGAAVYILSRQKVIVDCLKKWIWTDDSSDEVDDLMKYYQTKAAREGDDFYKNALCG